MKLRLPENVEKSEEHKIVPQWRWAIRWALIALTLSALPIIWAVVTTPAGGEFGGFLFNTVDGNTYLSKMEQGRQGSWTFQLSYTPEKGGSGAVIFVLYLLLGKLAGLLGVSNVLIYHLARLVFGFGLFMACYRFICLLFDKPEHQRLAFLLVCFSSGLGWITFLLGVNAPDFWVSESLTFFSIFANPHFPLATMLLVLTLLWALEAMQGKPWYYAAAAGTAFIMGFVHPFLLFTVAAVLGLYWLCLVIADKNRVANLKNWAMKAFALIGIGLAGVPGPLVTLFSTSRDHLLSGWMSQNETLSLDPLTTASGYGLLIPLALLGAWRCYKPAPGIESSFRLHPAAFTLICVWAGVTPVLIYLPVGFQRRLLEGWHFPLICMAVVGWREGVWPWLQKRRPRRKFQRSATNLVLFCSLSTAMLLLIATILLYIPRESSSLYDPVQSPYLSAAEVGAFRWLRENSTADDIVITGPVLGNYLPGRAHNRVFFGHPMETLKSDIKFPQLEKFFRNAAPEGRSGMTQTDREGLISAWGIKYLMYGWREAKLGDFDPASVAGWQVVYQNDDVKLYQVK